jgi:hypothetical protein
VFDKEIAFEKTNVISGKYERCMPPLVKRVSLLNTAMPNRPLNIAGIMMNHRGNPAHWFRRLKDRRLGKQKNSEYYYTAGI